MTTSSNVREVLLEQIKVDVAEGMDLKGAARHAMTVIRREGLLADLVQLILREEPDVLTEAIVSVWRRAEIEVITKEKLVRMPNRRVVAIELLTDETSILDSLHPIGNTYKPLREMTGDDCRNVADYYARLAEDIKRQERLLRGLALQLAANETVGMKFGERQLRALLDGSH